MNYSLRDALAGCVFLYVCKSSELQKLFSDIIYRIDKADTDSQLFAVVRSDLISHSIVEPGLFDILNNALEYDVFCHNF